MNARLRQSFYAERRAFTADGSQNSVPVVVVVLSPGLVGALSAVILVAVVFVTLRRRRSRTGMRIPEN